MEAYKFDSDEEMYAHFNKLIRDGLARGQAIGLVHGRITMLDLKRHLNGVKLFMPEVEIIFDPVLKNDCVMVVELETT